MKKWLYLSIVLVPLLILGALIPVFAQDQPPVSCTDTPEYCQVKVAQVPIPWQFWGVEVIVQNDGTAVTNIIDRIRISPTWLNPTAGQPVGEGDVFVSRRFAVVPATVGVIPLNELVWDFENDTPIPAHPDLDWQRPLEEERLLEQGLPPFIKVTANEDLVLPINVSADNSAVLVVYEVMADATGAPSPVVGHFMNEAVLAPTVNPGPLDPVVQIVEGLVNFDVHNNTQFEVTNFELDFLGIDFTCHNVTSALGSVVGTDPLELWGANENNPLVVRPIEGGTEVKWVQPDRPLKHCEWLHGGLSFTLQDLIDGEVVVDGTAVNVTVQGYWTVIVPCPGPCEGRMTGGGSVLSKEYGRVTHGFELHCDASQLPNNLEVNWGKGKKGANRFHLTELTLTSCLDAPLINEAPPVAGFDTYRGFGKGRLNGVDGATIRFGFSDEGEPGKNDKAAMVIWDADGTEVLKVKDSLKNGNHQAHAH